MEFIPSVPSEQQFLSPAKRISLLNDRETNNESSPLLPRNKKVMGSSPRKELSSSPRRRSALLPGSSNSKKNHQHVLKTLTYYDEHHHRQSYSLPMDEYQNLMRSIGVDLQLEQQDIVNMVVKELKLGLPHGWQQEYDPDDNIIYYNQHDKIATYVHPQAHQLRKMVHQMIKLRQNQQRITKDLQEKSIIPDSTVTQLNFQKRWNEKLAKQKQNLKFRQSKKVVLGSTLAQNILKDRLQDNIMSKEGYQLSNLVYPNTKSEQRLQQLIDITKPLKENDKSIQLNRSEDKNEIIEQTMQLAFDYYEKKFTKILCGNIENTLLDEITPNIDENTLKNPNFKQVELWPLLELASYYNINPQTQYYLLWIPKLALSLGLPPNWVKFINDGQQYSYQNLLHDIILHQHPADQYVKYFTEVQKKIKNIERSNHFKNFKLQLEDQIGREYDAKQQFCDLMDIRNIVKHSILLKLQQGVEAQQANQVQKWMSMKRRQIIETNSATAAKPKTFVEQFNSLTDAELFALSQQCNLDIEKDIHLIFQLSMIVTQVKTTYNTALEFRYFRNDQGQDIFYWRDTSENKAHKIFPLLNEVKQRLDVFKHNIEALERNGQIQDRLKDTSMYKKTSRKDPIKIKKEIDTEKQVIIERYLLSLLDKGKKDPKIFFNQNKKQFNKLTEIDIDRIYKLLGQNIDKSEIINFCFQSPFKFKTKVNKLVATSDDNFDESNDISQQDQQQMVPAFQDVDDIYCETRSVSESDSGSDKGVVDNKKQAPKQKISSSRRLAFQQKQGSLMSVSGMQNQLKFQSKGNDQKAGQQSHLQVNQQENIKAHKNSDKARDLINKAKNKKQAEIEALTNKEKNSQDNLNSLQKEEVGDEIQRIDSDISKVANNENNKRNGKVQAISSIVFGDEPSLQQLHHPLAPPKPRHSNQLVLSYKDLNKEGPQTSRALNNGQGLMVKNNSQISPSRSNNNRLKGSVRKSSNPRKLSNNTSSNNIQENIKTGASQQKSTNIAQKGQQNEIKSTKKDNVQESKKASVNNQQQKQDDRLNDHNSRNIQQKRSNSIQVEDTEQEVSAVQPMLNNLAKKLTNANINIDQFLKQASIYSDLGSQQLFHQLIDQIKKINGEEVSSNMEIESKKDEKIQNQQSQNNLVQYVGSQQQNQKGMTLIRETSQQAAENADKYFNMVMPSSASKLRHKSISSPQNQQVMSKLKMGNTDPYQTQNDNNNDLKQENRLLSLFGKVEGSQSQALQYNRLVQALISMLEKHKILEEQRLAKQAADAGEKLAHLKYFKIGGQSGGEQPKMEKAGQASPITHKSTLFTIKNSSTISSDLTDQLSECLIKSESINTINYPLKRQMVLKRERELVENEDEEDFDHDVQPGDQTLTTGLNGKRQLRININSVMNSKSKRIPKRIIQKKSPTVNCQILEEESFMTDSFVDDGNGNLKDKKSPKNHKKHSNSIKSDAKKQTQQINEKEIQLSKQTSKKIIINLKTGEQDQGNFTNEYWSQSRAQLCHTSQSSIRRPIFKLDTEQKFIPADMKQNKIENCIIENMKRIRFLQSPISNSKQRAFINNLDTNKVQSIQSTRNQANQYFNFDKNSINTIIDELGTQSNTRPQTCRNQDQGYEAIQLLDKCQKQRKYFKYYCDLIGNPMLDPSSLNTDQPLKRGDRNYIHPDDVTRIAKKMNINIKNNLSNNNSIPETDLLWVTLLLLATPLPDDYEDYILQCLAEDQATNKLSYFQYLSKNLQFDQHPGYHYFTMLLQNVRLLRSEYISKLDTSKNNETLVKIKECSWLSLKEKRRCIGNEFECSYYYNFYTNEKSYKMPDDLEIVINKEIQTQSQILSKTPYLENKSNFNNLKNYNESKTEQSIEGTVKNLLNKRVSINSGSIVANKDQNSQLSQVNIVRLSNNRKSSTNLISSQLSEKIRSLPLNSNNNDRIQKCFLSKRLSASRKSNFSSLATAFKSSSRLSLGDLASTNNALNSDFKPILLLSSRNKLLSPQNFKNNQIKRITTPSNEMIINNYTNNSQINPRVMLKQGQMRPVSSARNIDIEIDQLID